ncbi:pyrroline-5-carboxylate reductase [Sulfuritalea hydrogenivorans]|uniref:Pyrroline-5-carboxylate reductase n=1 Tax=Sulfuritalea hydrogenivorans sk43H TaxID=1223802 RepID=W0SAP7_9PROT|nr:pyrroline-5-carboxylate reductase [Sulfuritalea hydrogenivorans]BAO28081.1 pyrroline-5-carboxylate reductase [Sulfuritalea hydrogenivorans sk43H]
MKITFIGGGNMAVALIGGLRKQGFSAAAIQVVEPFQESRDRLAETFGVRCAAAVDAAALNCEILILAVKPQQLREAVAPIRGKLTDQLVVSIAAGLRMADISRWLGNYRKVVRTMPNTPALIGAGITGLCADPSVDLEGRTAAERILKAVGSTVWIDDETKMDAVTAVSGSGPAYVFYFLEAMEAAALNLGFAPGSARQLAVETFLGAARLAEQSSESISTLRERVTSKGGTTEAALLSFGANDIAGAIEQGILAAEARGRELGDMLGKD